MGYTEEICASTFEESCLPCPSQIERHSSQSTGNSSTINPIEKYFNPPDIRKAVDSLVLSKFAPQWNKILMKKINRNARRIISTAESSCSVNTCDVSDLLSYIQRATTLNFHSGQESTSVESASVNEYNSMYGLNFYSRQENTSVNEYNSLYGLNFYSRQRSTPVVSTSVNEYNSVHGSYSSVDYCSINATIELLQQNLIILEKNKGQVFEAMQNDGIHNKTLSAERLETEKLLVTDIRINSLVSSNKERHSKNNSNSFCSKLVKLLRCNCGR